MCFYAHALTSATLGGHCVKMRGGGAGRWAMLLEQMGEGEDGDPQQRG